jgi:hypothetical protein
MDSFQVTSPTIQFTGTTTINGQTPETQDHKNANNGYAGLDSNGDLVGTIILRQDTASNLSSVVLATGQEGYATDTAKLVVGDNATTFANLAGWSGKGGIFTPFGNGFTFPNTNTATGANAIAIGGGGTNNASGQYSSIIGGGGSLSQGAYSAALNAYLGNAYGAGSNVMGSHANAHGVLAFAFSTPPSIINTNSTNASADSSFAHGLRVTAGASVDTFTVSGTGPTTVTISGDKTTKYAVGDTILFFKLTGGTDTSVVSVLGPASAVTYNSGPNTTTFTVTSSFSDWTGGICVNTSYGLGSWATGSDAQSTKKYQSARSAGRFAATGDCQHSYTYLRNATTDATQTELTITGTAADTSIVEGSTNRYICALNKAYLVTVSVCGKQQSSPNVYTAKKTAYIVNDSGTITLSTVSDAFTPIVPSGWGNLSLAASSVGLQILVTGKASTNIRWNAVVEAVEVAY